MDVACQECGEQGGARRCPDDRYQRSEGTTPQMHLMNQQFYLLITQQDAA